MELLIEITPVVSYYHAKAIVTPFTLIQALMCATLSLFDSQCRDILNIALSFNDTEKIRAYQLTSYRFSMSSALEKQRIN